MTDEEKDVQMEEEVVEVDTLLILLQLRFEYTSECRFCDDKEAIQQKILDIVHANNMAPYMQFLFDSFMWPVDEAKMKAMKEANEKTHAELERELAEAEKDYGETEVREVVLKQADHCAKIGDKEGCLKYNKKALETGKVGLGPKLDLAFQRIRLGYAYNDSELIQEGINAANELLLLEGDWERRNRLKVYEAVYLLSKRQFKQASDLLLGALSAFSSPELITYKDFILFTVLVASVCLDRPAFKKKVLDSSEVLQVMPEIPHVNRFVRSLYDCKYDQFFESLREVCEEMLQHVYTSQHVNYFYREMRLIAFKQFLQSYRSVTLQSMADAFAIVCIATTTLTPSHLTLATNPPYPVVNHTHTHTHTHTQPTELLDHQLSIFISSGRLSAKVDKASGSVVTAQTDSRSYQYQQVCLFSVRAHTHTSPPAQFLKEGDILLNRVQKLARVAEKK